MTSPYIYRRDEVIFSLAIPPVVSGISDLIEGAFSIDDFNELSINPSGEAFTVEKGIWGETSIKYKRSNLVTINLSLQFGSDNNAKLNDLYQIQRLGVLGLPLSIRTIKSIEDNKRRPTYIAPVCILNNRPTRVYTDNGIDLDYTFTATYLQTIYI